MNVSRRVLVKTTSLAPVVALAACVGQPTTPTPPLVSQIATGANLIATGLESAIDQIAAQQGVTSQTVTTLNGYLNTIKADSAQIAAATATPATSTLQEIETDAQAILTVAAPFLPAGNVILPIINAAIDLATNLVGNAGARPGAYSDADARQILANAAQQLRSRR